MGIVERAVEKAQSEKKAVSADAMSGSAVVGVRPGQESVQHTASGQARQRSTQEGASLAVCDQEPIVRLDFVKLREVGRLPLEREARRTEDEIRRIKWPLLSAIAARNGASPARNNVILVTSALPGEGKTFASLNLALSIVRDRELRVILVDGDVARPGLTPALGLEGRPGLNDVLEDAGLEISAVTYKTDVEGLSVVPAGKWHERSPEFFASSRMPQVIQELIRRVGNGVILIDSPPLLATNEAQVVTRYVGQVLLVVRAEETQQRAVQEALTLVDKSATVKAVLNNVQASVLGRYYGEYRYASDYGESVQRSGRQDGQRKHE